MPWSCTFFLKQLRRLHHSICSDAYLKHLISTEEVWLPTNLKRIRARNGMASWEPVVVCVSLAPDAERETVSCEIPRKAGTAKLSPLPDRIELYLQLHRQKNTGSPLKSVKTTQINYHRHSTLCYRICAVIRINSISSTATIWHRVGGSVAFLSP